MPSKTLFLDTLSRHFCGNYIPFVRKFRLKHFRQMVLLFLFGTENRNRIELYHLQNPVNFFAFSTWSLALVIGTNGTENYGRFGKNGKTEKYLQRYYFFSGKFPSDESLHSKFLGISGFSIQIVSAHYLTDLLMSENISEIYKWKLRPRRTSKKQQ